MTTGIVIGIIIGIFIPAPYDALAKDKLSKLWAWVKSLVSSE